MKKQNTAVCPGKIRYSFFMKCTIYLLMLAAIGATVFSLMAGIYCSQLDDCRRSEENQKRTLEFYAWQQAREILRLYLSQEMEQVEDYASRENVNYAIYQLSGRRVGGNYNDGSAQFICLGEKELQYDFRFSEDIMEGLENNRESVAFYRVKIAYLEEAQVQAVLPYLEGLPEQLSVWTNRFWVAAGIAAVIAVAALGYLLQVSGHQPGTEELRQGRLTGAAPERLLLWGIAAAAVWLWGREQPQFLRIPTAQTQNAEPLMSLMGQSIRIITGESLMLGFLATGFLLQLSLYLKQEKWWQKSLIWNLMRKPAQILERLSWMKKTLLLLVLVCALEAAGIGWVQYVIGRADGVQELQAWFTRYGKWIIWGVWGLGKGFLISLVLRRSGQLMRLRDSGRQLAQGNLGFQIPIDDMKGELRRFGEDMNAISQVVAAAVEDQMRSEHLKTELITNVSHDIKTPLTSIINYADLIGREQTENEKITEYAQVLYRQSARLKKLIEDLMEVSRASTGNLEVHLERCQAGVLLEQAMGEYEQRLREKEIDLVVRQKQEPVWIMADPRMLWRILDNLMNNICKYAQSNTRVYLSLEVREGQAELVFKNISQYPLEIEASELLERFVRGDRSRHTEGSGLGLPIAQSLTQLQGGRMDLSVDGDLFKVTLTFPVVDFTSEDAG